jgi:hypothetical protein
MKYYSLCLVAKITPTILFDSMTWSIDAIINGKDNIMVWKLSITSKGMSYIKRIDMVFDWLMQIWYRLWKE